MVTIDEAVTHFGLGSTRTLKRRLAQTGLPEGERTRGGQLTEAALERLAELQAGKRSKAPAPAPAPTTSGQLVRVGDPDRIAELEAEVRQLHDMLRLLPAMDSLIAMVSRTEELQRRVDVLEAEKQKSIEGATAPGFWARVGRLWRR